MTPRAFQPDDREACLALFVGNVPRFFDAAGRAGFVGTGRIVEAYAPGPGRVGMARAPR